MKNPNESKRDDHHLKPYGDHWNDGKVQVSFTLPVKASEEAKEAARLYMEKMKLVHPLVASMEPMGEEFSFFVGYGYAEPTIDFTAIKVLRPEFPQLSREELVQAVKEKLGRPIVVVGGTTGSDAHTVGIDAILSMKGISGEKGLESYPCFKVINLRAQVSNSVLVEKAASVQADAILVSKLVTQQDQHLTDLKELVELLKGDSRLPKHLVKIAGGPRMDNRIAHSVHFDAGFGPGTKPSEVANYIVHEILEKVHHEPGTDRLEGDNPEKTQKKRRPLLGWFGGRGEDS